MTVWEQPDALRQWETSLKHYDSDSSNLLRAWKTDARPHAKNVSCGFHQFTARTQHYILTPLEPQQFIIGQVDFSWKHKEKKWGEKGDYQMTQEETEMPR